jgi:hypothetical protein
LQTIAEKVNRSAGMIGHKDSTIALILSSLALSPERAQTSLFSSVSPFSNFVMLSKVVAAMLSKASRVKKAW